MTDINNLKGRFYVQEAHIRMRDGGKTTRKNGAVYTPAECVDFINNSVAEYQDRYGWLEGDFSGVKARARKPLNFNCGKRI